MESFDVAVAFRVMIRRPSMSDAEPVERLDEPRRSELGPIVCGHRQASLAAARGQPFEHRLLDCGKRVFGSTTMRRVALPPMYGILFPLMRGEFSPRLGY